MEPPSTSPPWKRWLARVRGGGPQVPPDERLQIAPDATGLTVAPDARTQAPLLSRRWMDWFAGTVEPVGPEGLVTEIPTLPATHTEIRRDDLNPGRAYARIVLDEENARYHYEVIEPRLNERERSLLEFVKDVLIRTFDVDMEVTQRAVAEESRRYLEKKTDEIFETYRVPLSPTSRKRLKYYIERDFTGFGPIDVMMRDGDLEDISCDGARVPLYIYHRKFGSMASNVVFKRDDELDAFVIRMAQWAGRQITIAEPMLDGALYDGSRLQATLAREVTDNGSTFTIRRFRAVPLSPIDLVKLGTVSSELLAYLWILVQYGSSILFSGGTASGKTTALNAVSLFIGPQNKIVSIEDTRELNLPHSNWVRSVTRGSLRSSDSKRVDMYDLLMAALRQRPEYILVGEVRGKEAMVAFQAMATGHTVFGTLHADSARSVVYRLENEPINIPRIVLQTLDVICVQIATSIEGRRLRRMKEVVEVVGVDPATKELLTHTAFQWDPETDSHHFSGKSYKLDRIARWNNWAPGQVEAELSQRARLLMKLGQLGPLSFEEIARIISVYYRKPEQVEDEVLRLVEARAAKVVAGAPA